MRTFKVAAMAAMLMHASATGTVAAQDDPASRFSEQDRRPDTADTVDPPPAVVAAAKDAGVDPVDLQGAVNSTGLEPRVYLQQQGMLDNPAPPAPPPVYVAASTVSGVWTRLAQCEASGNWHVNTGNGYYGGLQEDMTFWRSYGGTAYASRPDLASPAAQVVVAQRGLAAQGWGAWPRCSRILGLR
jgi:hypothetical protein